MYSPPSITFVVVYATTKAIILHMLDQNQRFLYNLICILKVEIFGLRFYVLLKRHFKKRKESRFLDFQKKT